MVLAWPAAAPGFRLHWVTHLPTSNNWSIVSGTPVTVDGHYPLTDPATGGSKTYWLIFP